MQDKIIIKDLECFAYHGVLEPERQLGQKFLVSLELFVNTRLAGKTDNLEQSVNYASVCNAVITYMKEHTFQLIEAVAEELAQKILLEYPLVERLQISIKKPWAPVLLSLDTVAVEITRMWHTVYLGIGSNIGEKEENMKTAISCFLEHPLCKLENVSNFIHTKPYGVKEQGDFINGAFCIKTLLTPEELLEFIGTIEEKLQRVRKQHWGPRTIDVDILFYDELILHTEQLTIPHIEIDKRDFVLAPLCELNPYLLHPIYKKSVIQLFKELKERKDYENTI